MPGISFVALQLPGSALNGLRSPSKQDADQEQAGFVALPGPPIEGKIQKRQNALECHDGG